MAQEASLASPIIGDDEPLRRCSDNSPTTTMLLQGEGSDDDCKPLHASAPDFLRGASFSSVSTWSSVTMGQQDCPLLDHNSYEKVRLTTAYSNPDPIPG